MLAFDCETTLDYAQALTFGFARLYRLTWHDAGVGLKCIGEFCFHAGELPETDPDGYEALQAYCRGRLPALDEPLEPFPQAVLWLVPRSEFVRLFYDYAYKQRAIVVGFNLPFDISRLAVQWGTVTSRGSFYGGFRFVLSQATSKKTGEPREALWRPPIAINPIDSKRALIGFLKPGGPRASKRSLGFDHHSGQFLDLHTLARALTDESHSLKSAGETFNAKIVKVSADEHGKIIPQYIEYARHDVAATASLFEALVTDYLQDPLDLQPTRAFSAATRGKAHLAAMNIRPVLERQPDFPRDVLGHVMTTYYGGRAEARIRRVPPGMPVMYLDFLSMYPTVCALLDLWQLMTAKRIDVVEENPAALRGWLEELTLEDMFDPTIWSRLRVFVQIEADRVAVPVRARYGATPDFNIGVNYYSSEEPQWFAVPDVIKSKLLTGRTPEIVRAIRLVPVGRQRGMRSIKLRGGIEVNPYSDDFFRLLVEQRNRLPDKKSSIGRGLKTVANGTSYGIWAEMNRVKQPGHRTLPVIVHGQRTFACDTPHPERPGPYYFPPVAALIASSARLMLGILEALVTEAGGTYAFCDTDSMAIVSSENGGILNYTDHTDTHRTIPVLTWQQVREIVHRFESLNPYDREAVPGSILEIEEINFGTAGQQRQLWTFPISAKRYPLYTLTGGRPAVLRVFDVDDQEIEEADEPAQLHELAAAKQHGLGHLLNPLDPNDESRSHIDELWVYIVRTDALQHEDADPDWLDDPAVGRFNVSTPLLASAFHSFNHGKPHWRQVRPFNFLIFEPVNKPALQGLPDRFLLVKPYELDPVKRAKLPAIDIYSRRQFRTITSKPGDEAGWQRAERADDQVIVTSWRDVLADYRTHPEAKSLGPDRQPCDQTTIGLLHRRHVTPILPLRHRGKEGHLIEQRQTGIADPNETSAEYPEPDQDPLWQLATAVLRTLPVAQTATGANVSERTVQRARASQLTGHTARAKQARGKLIEYAVTQARSQLHTAGIRPPVDREALLATWTTL